MRYLYVVLAAATFSVVFSPAPANGQSIKELTTPAFRTVPELKAGYDLLYEQKFPEAREIFVEWAAKNPTEPFGQVSVCLLYTSDAADE